MYQILRSPQSTDAPIKVCVAIIVLILFIERMSTMSINLYISYVFYTMVPREQ